MAWHSLGLALDEMADSAAALGPTTVHVVTALLTDGGHNHGPALTAASAQVILERELLTIKSSGQRRSGLPFHHTVIAFCLTGESDANASMIVKEVFENAKVTRLPNVFYAKTHAEMTAGLDEVIAACADLFDSQDRGGAGFASIQRSSGCSTVQARTTSSKSG